MENQVATRGSNVPAHHQDMSQNVLASDLIVPYVVIGQGLSEAVVEKEVQMGDIYRTTNREVLGNPDEPIDIIFLHKPKEDWVLEEKPKGASKFEFRRIEPRYAGNETLPWSFWADEDGNEVPAGTKGATEWRRVKRLVAFAILPKDIEAALVEMEKAAKGDLPDPSKALTPVVVSFRSMSYKAGREVSTFFSSTKSMNVPIWRYMLKAGTKLDQNDQGAFYVWTIDRRKPQGVPKELLPMVETWVNMLNKGVALNVHEEGETSESGQMGATTKEDLERVATEVC